MVEFEFKLPPRCITVFDEVSKTSFNFGNMLDVAFVYNVGDKKPVFN